MSSSAPRGEQKPYFTGSCACSRITYISTAAPFDTQTCHCTTCRKLSGGASQSFTGVRPDAVTLRDSSTGREGGLATHRDGATDVLTTPTAASGFAGPSSSSASGITVLRFSRSAERFFCSTCGSALAMVYGSEKDSTVWLTVGSIDESGLRDEAVRELLRPGKEIFVAEKAWWAERSGLPSFEAFDRKASTG